LIIAFLVLLFTDLCSQEEDVAVELRRPSPFDVNTAKPMVQTHGM
jgi:hypothetical protein